MNDLILNYLYSLNEFVNPTLSATYRRSALPYCFCGEAQNEPGSTEAILQHAVPEHQRAQQNLHCLTGALSGQDIIHQTVYQGFYAVLRRYSEFVLVFLQGHREARP